MFGDVSYWAFFGTLTLLRLTYEDFKHNMEIDDRKNHFMLGISMSLITHIAINIWYLLGLIVIVATYVYLSKKYIKSIGEGDLNTLGWIIYGLGIISVYKMFWFMAFFSIIAGAYLLIKYLFCKYSKKDNNQPTPFYIVILISFIFNCWLFGLY